VLKAGLLVGILPEESLEGVFAVEEKFISIEPKLGNAPPEHTSDGMTIL
jgi:hypothetical protein